MRTWYVKVFRGQPLNAFGRCTCVKEYRRDIWNDNKATKSGYWHVDGLRLTIDLGTLWHACQN